MTVKPVTGDLNSTETGLSYWSATTYSSFYDRRRSKRAFRRFGPGNRITFRNDGNASVELSDGKQCIAGKSGCTPVQGKRLYAGAEWSEDLNSSAPVEYTIISNGQSVRKILLTDRPPSGLFVARLLWVESCH